MRNYTLSAGIHQNWQITYERALRNLTVLMFSHYMHQLECSRSLKGHWTLMVHECLQVAAESSWPVPPVAMPGESSGEK